MAEMAENTYQEVLKRYDRALASRNDLIQAKIHLLDMRNCFKSDREYFSYFVQKAPLLIELIGIEKEVAPFKEAISLVEVKNQVAEFISSCRANLAGAEELMKRGFLVPKSVENLTRACESVLDAAASLR